MNYDIIDFLNLKAEQIESLNTQSTPSELIVQVSFVRKGYPCPICNVPTSKIKNCYQRTINHGIFIHRKCTILFHQKRYDCPLCQSTFIEPNPFTQKAQKISHLSVIQIMDLLKSPHQTFKEVGNLLNLSPTTVLNTFLKNCPKVKKNLPKILCIDEVYLGRHSSKKYVAILMDFENNNVIDVIYGRSKDALHSYFQLIPIEERNNVEIISTDMYEGFRFLKNTYFKHAKVSIDAFHVIQLMNTMFNQEIKQIMNKLDKTSTDYSLLKNRRDLLLKNSYKIDWSKREFNRKLGYTISNLGLLKMMFEINPLIQELYELKETYLQINGSKSKEEARARLEPFILKCIHHSHPQVKRVGRTLSKWHQEILNSFTWFQRRRVTNGPIESRNNIIKLIIRNAAGYHNFDHLRLRILYCLNQKEKQINGSK